MTEDEQGGFRSGRGRVDEIFIIGDKAHEKKRRVDVSFR